MKNKINKKGIIVLIFSVFLIFVLFEPFNNSNIITETQTAFDGDKKITPEDAQNIDLFLQSVVDTDTVITDSDQSAIQNFLDESGVGFTEKFGIQTNIALIDTNNIVTHESNIFGINELPDSLSITDEDGNILDLGGSVQVSFESIAQSNPNSVTSWASVSFFLDDNKLDTKKLWASYQGSQNSMSVLNNLSFDDSNFPINPSFSDREKTNFTFTFTDEGLSNGDHTFRVVFDKVDAIVDNRNFNWQGENIIYDLTFNVDGNKITKESEDGNGDKISVFKSDNKFIFTTQSSRLGNTINGGYQHFATIQGSIDGIIEVFVNDELIETYSQISQSSEFTFARDSQLRIDVNGQTVYDEKQPVTQTNHYITISPKVTASYIKYGSCHSSGGGSVFAYATMSGIAWESKLTSSFGYEAIYPENHIGATSSQPYPC